MASLCQFLTTVSIDKNEKVFSQFFLQAKDMNCQSNSCEISQQNFKLFMQLYHTTEEQPLRMDDKLSLIRRISLTPSGLIYGMRQIEMANKVIRKHKDKEDYFMRLQLEDEIQKPLNRSLYITWIKFFDEILEGISLFGRKYEFFAWSASQLRTSSCWLFTFKQELLTREELLSSLGNFQGIKPVSRYSARIGQSLSASQVVRFQGKVKIVIEDDLSYEQNKLYSDGVGKISKNLIEQIKKDLKQKCISCVQIRYGEAKGVLVLNEELGPSTIVLRKSMIKFEGEYSKELNIVSFNRYVGGSINRQIILLLITLGVGREGLIELQDQHIKKINLQAYKDAINNKYFSNYQTTFEFPSVQDLLVRLINLGYDQSNNLFVDGLIHLFRYQVLKKLKAKCNINVQKSARLLGIIDEYNILNENEVYASYCEDNKNRKINLISGEVMITINPCLHPGDIRKATAITNIEVINRFNRNPFEPYVNCVVFPTKGFPMTAAMAGGDLDGDQYFITWDERLIPPKTVEPMQYDEEKSKKLIQEDNTEIKEYSISEQLSFLIEQVNDTTLGSIHNAHLTKAEISDSLAQDSRCLQLAAIHAIAVDFAKSGIKINVPKSLIVKEFPDYLEKKNYNSFESQTVLGELFRNARQIFRDESKLHNQGMICEKLPPLRKDFIYKYYEEGDLVAQLENRIDQVVSVIDWCFQKMKEWMKDYFIKSEYEVYSNAYNEMSNRDKKAKYNVEKVQNKMKDNLINLIGNSRLQLKGQNKDDYYWNVSLFYLILNYQQQQDQDDKKFQQMIERLFKLVQQDKNYQELNRFEVWYRGLCWFLCGNEILEIQGENMLKKKEND